jgi:catabolite regulation protein CreA
MASSRRTAINAEAAESLAIQALAFLAADAERLGRFLAITGLGPNEIRAAAREPHFLAGVLEYVTSDEQLLIDFANDVGTDPADIARACAALGRAPHEWDMP